MATAGFDNYTGPGISNGKYQSSVEFGDTLPIGEWSAWSRLHDSAFAHFDDYGHRTAANILYANRMAELGGTPEQIAAFFVVYGNQTKDSIYNIVKESGYGVVGLVYSGAKNAYNLADYAMNADKYKREVLDYYNTDPRKGDSRYDPLAMRAVLQVGGKQLPASKVAGLDPSAVKQVPVLGSKNMGNVTEKIGDKVQDWQIDKDLKQYHLELAAQNNVRHVIAMDYSNPKRYRYIYSPSLKNLQKQTFKKNKKNKINKIYVL